MVARAAISTYRRTAVETADGPKLILMAYEGAIQALTEAEERLAARDYEAKGKQLARAQDFLSALLEGINPEAGELALNLRALYLYMLNILVLIDPPSERERIVRAREMLKELHAAWKKIIEEPRQREMATETQGGEATV